MLLKYAGVFTAAETGGNTGKGFDAAADGEGEPVCVFGTFAPLAEGAKPPKGVLSWVGEPSPGQKPFEFEAKRREQDVRWMNAMIEDHIRTTFLSSDIAAARIAELEGQVRGGVKPPSVAADEAASLILGRP